MLVSINKKINLNIAINLGKNQLVRCSTVVRALAYGVMARQIDLSWWTHRAISRSSQCSTTGVRKAVILCGMMHIKEPLLLIRKSSPCANSGFPLPLSEWSFTICLMPYNRK